MIVIYDTMISELNMFVYCHSRRLYLNDIKITCSTQLAGFVSGFIAPNSDKLAALSNQLTKHILMPCPDDKCLLIGLACYASPYVIP